MGRQLKDIKHDKIYLIDHITQNKYDGVLVAGNLTETGSDGSWLPSKKQNEMSGFYRWTRMVETQCPVYECHGVHDRITFTKPMVYKLIENKGGTVYSRKLCDGLYLIVLGIAPVTKNDRRFLKNQFNKHLDGKFIIMFHSNLLGNKWESKYKEKFRKIIVYHQSRVITIICGTILNENVGVGEFAGIPTMNLGDSKLGIVEFNPIVDKHKIYFIDTVPYVERLLEEVIKFKNTPEYIPEESVENASSSSATTEWVESTTELNETSKNSDSRSSSDNISVNEILTQSSGAGEWFI
jgi:hypothetical protein